MLYKFLTEEKKDVEYAYVPDGTWATPNVVWYKIKIKYLPNNFYSEIIMVDQENNEMFTEVTSKNYKEFSKREDFRFLNRLNDYFGKQSFYFAPDFASQKVKIIKDKKSSKKEEERFTNLLFGNIANNLKDSGINGIILE